MNITAFIGSMSCDCTCNRYHVTLDRHVTPLDRDSSGASHVTPTSPGQARPHTQTTVGLVRTGFFLIMCAGPGRPTYAGCDKFGVGGVAPSWSRIRAQLLLRWPRNVAQVQFSLLRGGVPVFNALFHGDLWEHRRQWYIAENLQWPTFL